MEDVNRWYFTKEHLAQTPSRKSGIDITKELSYRQQAANFIQDMGQRLGVTQLCINTAIVYMHRFYVFHSFSEVHRNSLSVAALFLAAKVEEQPRKLEFVIKTAHHCLHKDSPPLDVRTEAYAEKQFEVVAHENVLLQTLGFVLAIEHPHTYVVKVCQLVKASKDLAQTSYFMATTSLHMTTMCLQYRPTIVACVCIHLACKWSSWKIEPCSEGKQWYYYVDKTVTLDLLETLTQEFIAILETSPHKFKRKFIKEGHGRGVEYAYKQQALAEGKMVLTKRDISSPSTSSISFNLSSHVDEKVQIKTEPQDDIRSLPHRPPSPPPVAPVQTQPAQSPPKKAKTASHSISIDVYREKKEKERLEQKPVEPVQLTPQQTVSIKTEKISPIVKSEKISPSTKREKISPPTKSEKVSPPSKSEKISLPTKSEKISPPIKSEKISPVKGGKISPPLPTLPELVKNVPEPPPKLKEKISKNNVSTADKKHPEVEKKFNHQPLKPKSEGTHSVKESKSQKLKISSGVSSDPIVVLERVDAKTDAHGTCVPDTLHVTPHEKVRDHKRQSQTEKVCDSQEPGSVPVTSTPISSTKSKHSKHKTNSLHNSLNSAQPLPRLLSPIKDLKTNGSKETVSNERQNAVLVNNIKTEVGNIKTESSRHEKRERHKSKHSSKDKSLSNHSEHSNPAIKVKIRRDIIKLPDKSQTPPSLPPTSETATKPIKIKLPKPPSADAGKNSATTSIKLVITKDKSGSGSYCTSHKKDRESKKRSHSPSHQDSNYYKHYGETPAKHTKLDHAHSSHNSSKQSRSRHSSSKSSSNDVSSKKYRLGNDSSSYLNVDVETYGGGVDQPYINSNSQYLSYQLTPPPPHGIFTNSNLSDFTQPLPPLPPPEPLPPLPPE